MTVLPRDPTIRRQVLASARRLLARDATAPVAAIVRDAGVSRATFYRHFGSRSALMAAVDRRPPPDARSRILDAAVEMLVRTSLAELEMDGLARAADVSRATLYRLFPGKAALLEGMIEAYSPFRPVVELLAERGEEPPEVVLPLIARTVSRIAERRLGLLRAVFHEVTLGSNTSIAGVRPILEPTIARLAAYMQRQMAAGRIRRMHPFLALQAFIGPIHFHLMTRPVASEVMPLGMSEDEAIDELVRTVLEGLRTGTRRP